MFRPLICRHCAKYGHTAKHCRTREARCLRCSAGHPTEDCKSDHKRCPHCDGNHAAWERSCPVLQEYFKKEDGKTIKPSTSSQAELPKVTCDMGTQTLERPTTTSTPTQTDGPPNFQGLVAIVEANEEDAHSPRQRPEEEEPDRWRRRTRQDTRSAAPPPVVPERPSCQRSTDQHPSVEDPRPELSDPELFPKTKNRDTYFRTSTPSPSGAPTAPGPGPPHRHSALPVRGVGAGGGPGPETRLKSDQSSSQRILL